MSTNEFAVSTGTAAKLTFATGSEVENANVLAGEFFNITPQIILRDIGGNIVESDSSSAIVASIFDNPAAAKLGLSDNLFVISARGKASYTTLTLDKVGRGYRLQFVLSVYDSLRNTCYRYLITN